jgi:hypothetical protein
MQAIDHIFVNGWIGGGLFGAARASRRAGNCARKADGGPGPQGPAGVQGTASPAGGGALKAPARWGAGPGGKAPAFFNGILGHVPPGRVDPGPGEPYLSRDRVSSAAPRRHPPWGRWWRHP